MLRECHSQRRSGDGVGVEVILSRTGMSEIAKHFLDEYSISLSTHTFQVRVAAIAAAPCCLMLSCAVVLFL